MKKIILSILILFVMQFPLKVFSQNSKDSTYFHNQTNTKQYIKFSFLNIFEPEPSLQLGYSYPIKGGKFQLQHELAYCFSPNLFWNAMSGGWDDIYQEKGFKIRSGFRFYFQQVDEFSKDDNKAYVGFDAMYKHVKITSIDQVVSRYDGAFNQIMDIEFAKSIYTLHAIIGKEVKLFGSDDVILDMYIGFGYRMKIMNKETLPEDIQGNFSFPMWWDDIQTSRQTNYILSMPSVMIGMKLGFGWK